MRRHLTVFLLTAVLCLLFAGTAMAGGQTGATAPFLPDEGQMASARPEAAEGVFRLPASLQEIGEEAFLGTDARAVILPDSAMTIGARAFAENPRLTLALLPRSVSFIAADAFDSCGSLLLLGETGSEAENYARRAGVPFVPARTEQNRTGLRLQASRAIQAAQKRAETGTVPAPTAARVRETGRRVGEGKLARRGERPELNQQTGLFP